jgi:hypothetical protein
VSLFEEIGTFILTGENREELKEWLMVKGLDRIKDAIRDEIETRLAEDQYDDDPDDEEEN